MRIPIGSRVETIERVGNSLLPIGSVGTIVGYQSVDVYHVEWDSWCDGHTCNGLAKADHGWNVLDHTVRELFEEAEDDVGIDLTELL